MSMNKIVNNVVSVGAPDCQDRVAKLLDQLTRLARGLQFANGLNPAQWDCLRFIGRANSHSRTPSAIATFLGTTKGTASQTIIALEGKGYVHREKDSCDRRVCRLGVTPQGEQMLRSDPLLSVRQAAEGLPGDMAEMLADGLEQLVCELRIRHGCHEFGVCCTCGHSRGPTEEGGAKCGLLQEDIPRAEATRICVSYNKKQIPAEDARSTGC